MAIAIQLQDAFDVETYDGLIAYIIAHLELDSESAAQVRTFIRKGEYRLDRLLTVPQRESVASLTTTAGEQSASLPDGLRQIRSLRLLGDSSYPLEPVTLTTLHAEYSDASGKPTAYAIADQDMYLGPVPDAAYSLTLTYLTKLPALSDSNQTNWLLSNNADAYIYSALWQAAGWLEDIDAAIAFRSELMAIIDEVNLQGARFRNAAPMRLRNPVRV